MHPGILAVVIALVSCPAAGQSDPAFDDLQAIIDASRIEGKEALQVVDVAWDRLVRSGRVPLAVGDSVVFLYRGKVKSVSWMGDFNAWGRSKPEPSDGTRLGNSDVWMLSISLPSNARVDYKLVLDRSEWILDPHNAHQQWSGLGGGSPNSELRMPDWHQDPIHTFRPDGKAGNLLIDHTIESKNLGYRLSYHIYLPHGYEPSKHYPVLYVTDGNEYLDPKLGNMKVVLDNLIADGVMRPIIVVFLDSRDPDHKETNRRMEELAMNPKYLEFLQHELIPTIEDGYPGDASLRGIMGTSLGGLCSAYLAASTSRLFNRAGI